jgi:DNA-directed RNA polymerase specialized sigma24 family protein
VCRSLLCAVANGNETAFAVLYDRFCDETWATCVRFAQLPQTPEEAMIELWMFVWENADSLSRDDSETGAVLTHCALRILWSRNELSAA